MSVMNQLMRINPATRTQLLDFSQFSNLAMIFLSLDFCVIDLNEMAGRIYGWDRQAIIGKSYLEWCKRNNISAPVDIRDRTRILNGLPIIDIETDIYNGRHILLWHIVGSLDEDNEPNGIILLGKEITHHKTDEANLETQTKKLFNISKLKTG